MLKPSGVFKRKTMTKIIFAGNRLSKVILDSLGVHQNNKILLKIHQFFHGRCSKLGCLAEKVATKVPIDKHWQQKCFCYVCKNFSLHFCQKISVKLLRLAPKHVPPSFTPIRGWGRGVGGVSTICKCDSNIATI